MSRGVKAAAILVVVLGAAAAVVLGVFQIRSIDVRGNERYLAEQIRDDLIYDFKTRNTLYFAWKYRNDSPAEDAPYLKSVQAVMLSPTSVRIQVKENQMVGRVQYEGSNVYYDPDGVVQEITGTIYSGIPLVAGVDIEKPRLYQKLVCTNSSLLRTMLNITQLLIKNELIPDSVTFDANQNMILRLGNVTVLLGQDEYLEEKVANLVSIYPQVEGQTGTLNMEGFTGKNEAITFKADSDTGNVQETEGDGSGQPAEGQGEEAEAVPAGDSLAGEGSGEPNAGAEGSGEADAGAEEEAAEVQEEAPAEDSTPFMVFDSSGTLRYDARVSNGQVVDSYGNPIDGCYVDENGYAVDAYWNVIDPATGQLAQ
ncbi:MAG: cell division protein FtsQ/DivIB [Lachnospiraceae bacterium]|nr:cell division protein FtsQ/DivIB [Lachnospiraceae bacterium]